MANLPPNSFLKPVEPVQASPYQRIDLKALGGLQPLISDLIQTNAPKNKFLAETYAADPNAIQSRMSEYEAYDPVKLEGLAGYLSPLAAASHKGAQYFKKGTVNQALSGLTGLDSATSNEWSPLLSGLNSVGNFGGQSMYEIDKLEDHLKGLTNTYSPLDAAEAQSLFQRAGKSLDPTGSLYGKQFYDKSKLGEIYDLVPDAGTNVNGVKVLGGSLNAWMNPSGSYFDPRPVKQGGYYYGDPWGFSHEVQRVKGTPYYFIPESNFQPTRSGTALTWYSPASSEGLYDYTYGGQRGLAFDPSKTNLSWTSGRNNDLYADKKGGGLFGDNFITDILDNKYVNTALSVIPVTAPYMAAYNAANALYNDDPVGAILSGVGGALSVSGLNPASVIGEGANTALNLGLGTAGQMALGGSLYGAGMGALRGGGLQGALTGALTGGLGGYAGNYMSGLTKDLSPLAKMAAQTAYGSGVGGLSSMVQGKGFSQGASNAARRGITNAAVNAALNSQLYRGLV